MSSEFQSELPPEYKDLLWIFATTNLSMVKRASNEYGVMSGNIFPVSEPKEGKSRWPAAAKNNIVSLPLLAEDPAAKVVVVSADVCYYWDGKKQHRADRKGPLSKQEMSALKHDAVKRYREPFVAHWDVTIASHILHSQLRRLTTFSVYIDSQTGIPKSDILDSATPTSNAMGPIAELGAAHGATFEIKQKKLTPKIPTSSEHAVRLVGSKILPLEGMAHLLSGRTEQIYVDRVGQEWNIPRFDVQGMFGIPRE